MSKYTKCAHFKYNFYWISIITKQNFKQVYSEMINRRYNPPEQHEGWLQINL